MLVLTVACTNPFELLSGVLQMAVYEPEMNVALVFISPWGVADGDISVP